MKNNILVFGTKNFNNSFNEIKEYLNFSLIFYDKKSFSETSIKTINFLLIDSEVCNDLDVLSIIKNIPDIPLLLLKGQKIFSPTKFSKLVSPFTNCSFHAIWIFNCTCTYWGCCIR